MILLLLLGGEGDVQPLGLVLGQELAGQLLDLAPIDDGADQLGQSEVAELLRETLEEEKQADALLTELAESGANQDASAGGYAGGGEEEMAMAGGNGSARRRSGNSRGSRSQGAQGGSQSRGRGSKSAKRGRR